MMWLVEFDVPTEVLPPCGEDSDACTKQVVWALLSRVMVTGWVKISPCNSKTKIHSVANSGHLFCVK